MTNETREQVVELLRCAADEDPLGGAVGLCDAEDGYELGTQNASFAAYRDLVLATGCTLICETDTFRWRLLEAAQRVEEGSWP